MKKSNVTEGQKRLMMVIITILLCVLTLTMGIQPMNKTIKENEERLVKEKKTADDMRTLIDDVTIEPKYEKLKVDSQLIFERNYKGFKANEKLEEILKEFDVEIDSLNISDYTVLDSSSYEMNVVQPKTAEEYSKMQAVIKGPLMSLFLVSRLSITGEVTEEKLMQIVNAINNIPSEGPGDSEMSRYCLQIPEIIIDRSNLNTNLSINMYGMVPPPIDAAEGEE